MSSVCRWWALCCLLLESYVVCGTLVSLCSCCWLTLLTDPYKNPFWMWRLSLSLGRHCRSVSCQGCQGSCQVSQWFYCAMLMVGRNLRCGAGWCNLSSQCSASPNADSCDFSVTIFLICKIYANLFISPYSFICRNRVHKKGSYKRDCVEVWPRRITRGQD